MEQFKHISVAAAQELLAKGEAKVVDIRDERSFSGGHIDGAFHLTNDTLSQFTDQTPATTPVIVCCYHGMSSQQVAQFLVNQGFEQVYSLDGGYAGWSLVQGR